MDVKSFVLIVLSLALVLGVAESFDYQDKDLASEENLWDLYERWRSHHRISRDLGEKQKRFNVFKTNGHVVIIDGYENVPANDEDALLKAAANQPVSVAIDAGGSDFQLFSEGVFTGPSGTQLNHGVAVVGHGATLEGTKYWIVKNSWSQGWGEKGYIRMRQGVPEKEGLCGIAMDASYPIKLSSNNDNKSKDEEL